MHYSEQAAVEKTADSSVLDALAERASSARALR